MIVAMYKYVPMGLLVQFFLFGLCGKSILISCKKVIGEYGMLNATDNQIFFSIIVRVIVI